MVSGWFQVTSNAVLFTGCTFMLTGGVLQAEKQKHKQMRLSSITEKKQTARTVPHFKSQVLSLMPLPTVIA